MDQRLSMIGQKCGSCGKWLEAGDNIIGFPVIHILGASQSRPAGTEVLFHVKCFMKRMKDEPEAILLATSNGHSR